MQSIRNRGPRGRRGSSPTLVSRLALPVDYWTDFAGEKPDRVAFLVSSEYEGIFHNGGVGTHYRTLSQQPRRRWLACHSATNLYDRTFGGRSELAAVKHVFSTKEVREVLELKSVHERSPRRESQRPL